MSFAKKVSILICADKFDKYFKQAIYSCLNQTFTDFEIILVVNGVSKENQYKFIAFSNKYECIKLYFTDIHCLTYALNFGLDKCSGIYIARMDADDIAYSERLEKQVLFMDKNPDIAICGTFYELIDENNKKIKEVKLPVSDADIRRALYWSNPLSHPSAIIRSNILKKFCGYIGGIYAQDYDLWLRLSLDTTIKFYNINEILLGYRKVNSGMARRSKLAYANDASYCLRNFLLTGNILWLLGSFVFILKMLIRSNSKS